MMHISVDSRSWAFPSHSVPNVKDHIKDFTLPNNGCDVEGCNSRDHTKYQGKLNLSRSEI